MSMMSKVMIMTNTQNVTSPWKWMTALKMIKNWKKEANENIRMNLTVNVDSKYNLNNYFVLYFNAEY